jgi:hypothetical protein
MRPVILMLLGLTASAVLAIDEKPAPAPPPDKLYHREPAAEWLWAIERLRVMPKPGEIRTSEGINTGVTDIYDLKAEETQQIEKVVSDYDAAVLQRVAKWESELKELRAEYEAKVIAALPESKQAEAKKVLDLTHDRWVTTSEREGKYMAKVTAKAKAFREAIKDKTPDEKQEAQEAMAAWVKSERAMMRKEDMDLIAMVRALLSPEAAKKLDKFDPYKQTAADQGDKASPLLPAKKDGSK